MTVFKSSELIENEDLIQKFKNIQINTKDDIKLEPQIKQDEDKEKEDKKTLSENLIYQKIDIKSYELFNLLNDFISYIIENINDCHLQICVSENNSIPINSYIESLCRAEILGFIRNKYANCKVYCGKYRADSSFELDDCYLHIDNKGVKVTKDNKGLYKEIYGNDHKDDNFHMKSTQSNLSKFYSKIAKKEVCYDGKLPKDTAKPHLSFIIKHIWSKDNGIHKIILYSIPHCSYQNEYYKDIQFENNKKRPAKSHDSFRFNMSNKNNEPYKFLDSNKIRFKIFEYLKY